MTTALDIIETLDKMFPKELEEPWDTTEGLVSGDAGKEVHRVVVSLEFRDNIPNDADMLLFHHPPIFGPEKKVTNPFYKRRGPGNEIIYAIHSRIDKSGFVSKAVAERVLSGHAYNVERSLHDGTAIISLDSPVETKSLISDIKENLRLKAVNAVIKNQSVKRIAVHGGEAYQMHHIEDASKENVDLYLGGDMAHHLAEGAHFFEMSFVDIGHYSEQEGMRKLCEELKKSFPDVTFEYIEQKPLWSIE